MDLIDGEKEHLKECIKKVLDGSANSLDIGYIMKFRYDREPNRSIVRRIVEMLEL